MADGSQNNNLLVARALASSVKTLLGPNQSFKCCTSDGDAVICSSASKLLQLFDIQHPAGFIINDACQGQYKKYRTNCKTLICMAGFWSKAAQDLQDQGVPCPVIVRLFDDALEACEEVCQELAFPLMEALQSPFNAQPMDENVDTVIVRENATSSAMGDCRLGGESDKVCVVGEDDGHGNSDSDGDEDDVSWYFDGHIPGPDSHIPGKDNPAQGLSDHIPKVISRISGANGRILGVPVHIPGTANMENVDDSCSVSKALLHSILPNPQHASKSDDLSSEINIDEGVVSNEKNQESALSGVEYSSLGDCLGDTNVHVTQMASTSGNSDSSDKLQKITNKYAFLGESENTKRSLNSSETFHVKHITKASQHTELISTALSSRNVGEDDEEDEFEASFLEAVSNSSKKNLQSYSWGLSLNNAFGSKLKNLGNEMTKLSVAEKPKDNSSSVAETTLMAVEAGGKEIGANLQSKSKSSRIVNMKLLDSQHVGSSGCKDKEITDRLLFRVKEKLQSKGKATGTQFKLSEIYKGSRHFTSSSVESVLAASSSRMTHLNRTTDIFPGGDCLTRNSPDKTGRTGVQALVQSTPLRTNLSAEKLETDLTGKTSVQLMTRTGQAGKVDSVHLASAETFLYKNTNHSVTTSNSKEKLEVLDKNRDLLTQLGDRLAHGKLQEMKLAVEVITSIFKSSGKAWLEEFEIRLNMIHTELIFGPPSSFSQTVDGLLLENTTAFQFSAIVSGSQLFIALVNGDITADFRHTGLNNEVQIHRIINNKEEFKESMSTQEEYWYQRNTRSLSDHKIGVLIAKGIVQDSILDYCLSQNIVVLQNVAYPSLQLLSFATGSAIVTYLADLRDKDVGRPVTIETWDLGWTPSVVRQSKVETGYSRDVRELKARQFVLIKEVKNENGTFGGDYSPLQTVLLCGPCKDHVCDAEHRFWNSIYRLKNALACGRVLPGAGAPEIACIRRLNELGGKQSKAQKSLSSLPGWLQGSLDVFRPLVYSAFAQGFKEYLGSVIHNSGTVTMPSGASTYIEELITTGFCLDFLVSAEEEMLVNNLSEADIGAQHTRGHPRNNVQNVAALDPVTHPKAGMGAPLQSRKLSRKEEVLVWDDYTAKKEAWKRGVGVVRILLQSDKLVKTGLESSSFEADIF